MIRRRKLFWKWDDSLRHFDGGLNRSLDELASSMHSVKTFSLDKPLDIENDITILDTWVTETDVCELVVGDHVIRCADAEPYAVLAVSDRVVTDGAAERLEVSNAGILIVVNGVVVDLGVVGTAVEEDTHRAPVVHRVVENFHVVAALRRDDTYREGR